MLDHLFVKGFQSHSEALIEFVPGVNAIIGDPNSGKTALLRALRWVATNRPLSDSFIQRGGDEARAQVVLRRGDLLTAVTRVRGKNVNTYSLVDNAHDTQYTAFGTLPPDEVTEALNLDDLNYQPQLAPYFLVFESPGAVAGYIRAATGLEDVKEVLDILARKHRQAQGLAKDKAAELELVEANLARLCKIDTDRLASLIQSVESIQAESDRYRQQAQSLAGVISQLQEVSGQALVLPEDHLQEIATEVGILAAEHAETASTLSALDSVIAELSEVQQRVPLPDNLDTLFASRFNFEAEYNGLNQQISDLGDLIMNLSTVQEEGGTLATDIRAADVEVQGLRAQVSTCPSCGSTLTDETKRILLGEAR